MTHIRRKRDGSLEEIRDCPLCGSQRNWEVNSRSGLFHCWACGHSGKVSGGSREGRLSLGVPPGPLAQGSPPPPAGWHPPETREPPGSGPLKSDMIPGEEKHTPYQTIPEYVKASWTSRGLSAEQVLALEPAWDGLRLLFPVTGGPAWERAVYDWDLPKVRSPAPKGLLGLSRLPEKAHVVLVEGDYKAAAVPRPWFPVALGGKSLSAYQAMLLLTKAPFGSLTVCLDGGEVAATGELVRELLRLGVKPTAATLPASLGPDDVPRARLITSLLEAT